VTTQPRRQEARRQRLVLQLLPAVERMLAGGEHFSQLSVERLITDAAVSRTTFYRYFADKGELLAALSASAIGDIVAAAEGLWALPDDAGRDDVAAAIDAIVRVFLPHTHLMAAVTDTAGYDAGVRERFAAGFGAARAAAAAAIAQGQAAGTMRATLDPDSTAAWLTWMAERGMSQLVAPATSTERRQLVTTLTDIIWFTLYESPRRAAR
jgi:AcrR family transcriptional regulator